MGACSSKQTLAYLSVLMRGKIQTNTVMVMTSPLTQPMQTTTLAVLDLLGEYFSGDLGDQGDADGYAIRVAYKNGKFEPVFRYSYLENESLESIPII